MRVAWILLVGLALRAPVGADPRTAYYEGQIALEEGRFSEAGKAFAEAGRGGYPAAKVHLGMGLCYLGLGAPSRAADHLQKALAAGEGDALVRARLAKALVEADRFDEALVALEPLFTGPDAEPDDELRFLRGRILLDRKDYMGAYDQLRLAVRTMPDEVLELAEQFPMEMDEALQELARMVAEEPPTPEPTEVEPTPEPTQVQGLNRVGGVLAPAPPPPLERPSDAPSSAGGGGMHVIKSKASKGTKVGVK
jgi:tetratricopeptide (TPR) repeat protein